MTHFQDKAEELRAQAEKRMTTKGFFETLFGSGSNRVEQAIGYYQKAGNLFKLAKNWQQAGTAYGDAAELNYRINDQFNAANFYVEAANCFKKCDVNKAVSNLQKAIEIYMDMGKFVMVAKYHQMIGEILDEDLDMDKAVIHYEQAADFFRGEDSHSCANKCLIKVAEYAATTEFYDKAIDIFQQIACFDLASSLLKYNAKQYFFRAALCHLCKEYPNIRGVLKYYVQMFPGFEESREYQLLTSLVECVEECDIDGFTRSVKKYDMISKIPDWHSMILLRIKRKISDAPDLR